jgi:hypothetical protein
MSSAPPSRTADPLERVLDAAAFETGGMQPGMAPAVSQHTHLAPAEFMVAQRVPERRDLRRIMPRLDALAAAAGDAWVYGWDVNDRKGGRKVRVEGPTIKLANDLWREYGNCAVDTRVVDQGTTWIFYAKFIDLESGANMVRSFQQRKGQNTGMDDSGRAMDMVFQIGQSKAIRNVVVNALQTLSDYCVEQAKGSIVKKIAASPEAAREKILGLLDGNGIDRARVEAVYGRTAAHWTVPDMAKIFAEIRSIKDGFTFADEVWPVAGDTEPPKEKPAAAKKTAGNEQKPGAKAAAEPPATTGATQPAGATSAPANRPPGAARGLHTGRRGRRRAHRAQHGRRIEGWRPR